MALIKTMDEIAKMREGGALLSRALQAAADAAKPGITMRELDDIATRVIEEGGGVPSFKNYRAGGTVPFPSTMCISRNNEVVHGLGDRNIALEEGDIVGLDIGLWLHDLCTDMAITIPIGTISKERMALLRNTRESMYAGVEAAVAGNTVLDIGAAVEDVVNPKYGIVTALVGHGVGHAIHEKPSIPNFRTDDFPNMTLQVGMCLAIEPMVTLGTDDVCTLEDGWTIATADGSDAAHFEVTLAILESGPEILTPQPIIRI